MGFMANNGKELDRELIIKDAKNRGLSSPQFHDGEAADIKFETEDKIRVTFIGGISEMDWIISAYNVVIASWVQEPKLDTPVDEMIRVIKYEKFATVPYEAFNMTIGISGVTRAITHQIVRHRQFGFFQESFRNTDLRVRTFRLPRQIASDEELSKLYKQTIRREVESYMTFVESGVSFEEAREILPMGTTTYIGMTGNLRAWMGYFQARTSDISQYEHHVLTDKIIDEFKHHYPLIWDIIKDKV